MESTKNQEGYSARLTNGTMFKMIQKCIDSDNAEGLQRLIDTVLKDLPEHLFPNYELESGHTPLGTAVWHFKFKCVKVLLDHPRINVYKTRGDENAKDSVSAVTLTMMRSIYTSKAESRNLRLLKILADHPKVNVNKTAEEGLPPLHMATMNMSTAYLKYLLSRTDIDLEVLSKKEETCVGMAIRLQRLEHLKILLSHPEMEMNPDSKLIPGLVPRLSARRLIVFFHCVEQRKSQMVGMLLAAGVDPNNTKRYGPTAVWSPYISNYMSLQHDKEEHHLELRMEIANRLWQAGAVVRVPEPLRKLLISKGPSSNAVKEAFKRAEHYISQVIPSAKMTYQSNMRLHYKRCAQKVAGRKNLRPHLEKFVATTDLSSDVKNFILESEDLAIRDNDSDDEIE